MKIIKYDPLYILNNVVFPCAQGVYLISERPALEGVHAVLCAYDRENFETHSEGLAIIYCQ